MEAVTSQMNSKTCPSFKEPPVVETVLSIQFDELLDFKTIHHGMYHATIKEKYPFVSDQPRLEPIVESFPLSHMGGWQIRPSDNRPGRVWFRDDEDGSQLLQLQPDRFSLNWCKQEGVEYPRYRKNRSLLFDEFEGFCQFANENDLGEVLPNLCEVTYINHIVPKENESVVDCMETIFTGIKWESADNWLSQPPEAVTLNRVFQIGEQKGRLYVESGISHSKQFGQFILLKITARVIHRKDESLHSNMDLAHEWVVKSFASLTETQVRNERWRQES